MSVFNKTSPLIFDKIYSALPYWLKNSYYRTRDFFSPRQKWLTKKIGRSWEDKVSIILTVAKESIIHFVEEEEAFESIEWSATEHHKEAGEALTRAYQIVKIKLPALEKQKDLCWKDPDLCEYFHKDFMVPVDDEPTLEGNKRYKVGDPSTVQRKALDSLRNTDQEIEKLEQEVVEIVAKYRNYMGT